MPRRLMGIDLAWGERAGTGCAELAWRGDELELLRISTCWGRLMRSWTGSSRSAAIGWSRLMRDLACPGFVGEAISQAEWGELLRWVGGVAAGAVSFRARPLRHSCAGRNPGGLRGAERRLDIRRRWDGLIARADGSVGRRGHGAAGGCWTVAWIPAYAGMTEEGDAGMTERGEDDGGRRNDGKGRRDERGERRCHGG